MTNEQVLDRATKAAAVLENPLYIESWDNTRAAIIALIEKTSLADTQTAEDLRRCLKLLRDVRANLELQINLGKGAAFTLKQIDERRKNPLRGIFGTR